MSPFILSMLVVYLLRKGSLQPSMSSYQVFRNTLIFLGKCGWRYLIQSKTPNYTSPSTKGGMGVYWIHPDVCVYVRPSIRTQGFWIFFFKLLAQFIWYLVFTLMGWPLLIFVLLAPISALWRPNILAQMGFTELCEKTIGSVHFIPGIYTLMGWVSLPLFIFGSYHQFRPPGGQIFCRKSHFRYVFWPLFIFVFLPSVAALVVPNTVECRYNAVQYCKILYK